MAYPVTTYNNTVIQDTGNMLVLQSATAAMTIKNNATSAMSSGYSIDFAPGVSITSDYNVLHNHFYPTSGFTPGAHDTIGDAALDATFLPTASGNCDGNGDPSVEDFVGDSDAWGYVFRYDMSFVPRGARARPAIYGGASLQPDLF